MGFTLIELMFVVVLLAILVTIAVPVYEKFQFKAKISEAKANLCAIRSCQETYYFENDSYRICALHPAVVPAAWDAAEIPEGWIEIGFAPAGKLRYSYEVAAGPSGIVDSFFARAYGDLDGDGIQSLFSMNEEGSITSINPLE